MDYRYQKNQIFRKRLNVPKYILNKVYSRTLPLKEYVEFQLNGKIPTSCINESERKILERFGFEKCRNLDFDLLDSLRYDRKINIRDKLMSIDPETEDINLALYELLKDKISPNYYSAKMSKVYSDRLFVIPEPTESEAYDVNEVRLRNLKWHFNFGNVGFREIVENWDLFKDKDLSYCLAHDNNNKDDITDKKLKDFMSNYGGLVPIIIQHNDIYTFISTVSSLPSEEERHNYIKQFTDDILSNTIRKYEDYRPEIKLTDKQYKEVFKYSSMEEYLNKINSSVASDVIEELKSLPKDYIFNTSIPFSELINPDVMAFIGLFGLKNVVDFNDECGDFFTKDDYYMLKYMNNMYIHYAGNESDRTRNIFCDKDGKHIGRGKNVTKDNFYEAMRRMIVFGPSDFRYVNRAPDYRDIVGEFRIRNKELFISEEAPEDLQKLFYTKKITPELLIEHPEYIEFLDNKDLSSCFKYSGIKINGENGSYKYLNLYKYLSGKIEFKELMKFILEYNEVLNIVLNWEMPNYSLVEPVFEEDDSISQIRDKFHMSLRKIIVERRIPYPPKIPKAFMEQYPNMFLDKNAPQELQEAFYNRTITPAFILSNPLYLDYLRDIDLEVLFKHMPVLALDKDPSDRVGSLESPNYIGKSYRINFVNAVKHTFGEENALNIMLMYGEYIEQVHAANGLNRFLYNSEFTQEELLNEMDRVILLNIIAGKMKYDENIPEHFQKNNPTLFLDKNVSPDIKKKFYNREFTLKDFNDDHDLINLFDNVNIACAFPEDFAWIIPLFNNSENNKIANYKRLRVVAAYSRIEDKILKSTFRIYVEKFMDSLNIEKIDDMLEVFSRLEYSNSIELSAFKNSLAVLLLNTDDPVASLSKIEDIFLRNNLPLCGKMFLCFQVLYPKMSDVGRFKFDKTSRIAPELKDDTLPKVGFHVTDDEKRLIIIFNDLLRVSYRSNERSLVEYLDNIEKGYDLYSKLQSNSISINDLSDKDLEILKIFVGHLIALYDHTKNVNENELNIEELPLEEKLMVLSEAFKPNERYDLKDRIVRSFCYAAGIKSFAELKQLVTDSLKEQRERTDKNLEELEKNNGVFRFEEGDIVRGIGYLDSLSGSINAGNFSKEHLGVFLGTSDSDTTPLDVDLTYVTCTGSIYNAIKNTPTGFGFGNIYIIIKKDNPNFYVTRDKDGNLTGEQYNPRKVEIFGTATEGGGYTTHWGARTGISLADVDYILFKKREKIDDTCPYDENGNVNYLPDDDEAAKDRIDELQAVKFEIAKNGYYIPVIDFSGRLVFTKEEFNELRKKMQGLSYFGENDYELSKELVNPEIEEIASTINQKSKEYTDNRRNQVAKIVKEFLDEMGLTIKYKMDGDLSSNSVEFIDTGSTGRDTNVPYEGDFDFYMRLDANIMRNQDTLNDFKGKILNRFMKNATISCYYTDSGDLRVKGLKLESGEEVDVDISFGVKTSKVKYSSDECLKDRLDTIKKLYPDQYKYVVANIIMAKKILKSEAVNAYKARRSDANQGGLGGIGIENWILQNGGSFTEACRSFVNAAIDKKTGEIIPFKDFKSKYQIWDFGENHFSARKKGYLKGYLYDNFVENNMNEIGYVKMANACREYLKSMEFSQTDTETIKR